MTGHRLIACSAKRLREQHNKSINRLESDMATHLALSIAVDRLVAICTRNDIFTMEIRDPLNFNVRCVALPYYY